MVAVSVLDGRSLLRGVRAGAQRVHGRIEALNRINVYPVADGDTGTNLAYTMRAMVDGVGDGSSHAGEVLRALAERAIDGARGNSGAIFAQFVAGLSMHCAGRAELDARAWSAALMAAQLSARQAVAEPQEGTMLSVMRALAETTLARVSAGIADFAALWREGLSDARRSLAATTEQLPQLKRAGVVDAGAQGFVAWYEGMQAALDESLVLADDPALELPPLVHDDHHAHGDGQRWCAEAVIRGTGLARPELIAALGQLHAQSVVIAAVGERARVHAHVNDAAAFFATLRRFGEVDGIKADDLVQQQAVPRGRTAVVTDSAADLPEALIRRHAISVVPVRLQRATRDEIDKVTISARDVALRLADGERITTSQPPPGDFRRAYEQILSRASDALSVHVSARLSGTAQAAAATAERIGAGRIRVLDSASGGIGQGLVVLKLAEELAAGLASTDVDARFAVIKAATRVFLVLPDLSCAVRGGRLPAWVARIAGALNLIPILADRKGRLAPVGAMWGRRQWIERFVARLARQADRMGATRFLVAHVDARADAQRLKQAIIEQCPELELVGVVDSGAALAAHAGPGALMLALQRA